MVIKIRSNWSKQSPPHTISHSPKNFKPNQAKSLRECEREKMMASFQNSMNGHFSGSGILRKVRGSIKDCFHQNRKPFDEHEHLKNISTKITIRAWLDL